jgi:hypothetical protein
LTALAAAPRGVLSLVIITRGGRICFFSSLRNSRLARWPSSRCVLTGRFRDKFHHPQRGIELAGKSVLELASEGLRCVMTFPIVGNVEGTPGRH